MDSNAARDPGTCEYPDSVKYVVGCVSQKRKLLPDDPVHLVFITPHNFMWGSGMTRKEASDMLRTWYHVRDAIMKGENVPDVYRNWLAKGTFAINQDDFATWAIGLEHVIGMYIREVEIIDSFEAQRKAYEAQREMFEMIKKQVEKEAEDKRRGEEWRVEDE